MHHTHNPRAMHVILDIVFYAQQKGLMEDLQWLSFQVPRVLPRMLLTFFLSLLSWKRSSSEAPQDLSLPFISFSQIFSIMEWNK